MGIPLYGQSFSLADAGDRGLNAKSYGPGEAGEFTGAGGFLAFYEVDSLISKAINIYILNFIYRFAIESKIGDGQ